MDSLPEDAGTGPAAVLSRFRLDFHACLTTRADELCELADAVLCADGPVRSLAALSLSPGHRRGHGALYDAVNHGRIDIARLRRSLAGLPLPRAADGRLVLAANVSNWLRPGAATSPERLFCHVYGRGKGQAQMIPGWPYSVSPRWRAAAPRGPRCWTPSAWAPRTTRPRSPPRRSMPSAVACVRRTRHGHGLAFYTAGGPGAGPTTLPAE